MNIQRLLILVAIPFLLGTERLPGQPPAWRRDYQAALTEAEERGAPLFILFAGLPCWPAEQMYKKVLVGPEIREATRDFVPIICHLQETRKSYFLGWPAYLRQYFFTPSYVFARPDGRPLMEKFTLDTQHRMLPLKTILARLKKVRAGFGKVMPRDRWLAARGLWEKALAAREMGEDGKADALLVRLGEMNVGGPLDWRAGLERRRRQTMRICGSILTKLAGQRPPAHPSRLEALDYGRQGWFDLAWEVLRKAPDKPWRANLSKTMEHILKLSIHPGRVKVTQICPDREYRAYWQIGVSLAVDLEEVDNLTVQWHVEVEGGQVFAGYQTLDAVERNRRLQVAAYLPLDRIMRREGPAGRLVFPAVTRVAYRVYAGGFLACGGGGPVLSPRRPQRGPEPLVFLEGMDWSWEKETDNQVLAKGLVFGSKAPYDPPPPPSREVLAEIMVKVLDDEIVMPSMRTEVKLLMDMGAMAVKPLLASFDPKQRAVYTYARILAALRAPEGVAPLTSCLSADQPRVCRFFLGLLQEYGDGRVVPLAPLLPLLADEDVQVRRAATGLVDLLRDEKALGPLQERLAVEEDEDVQAALIGAVKRLTLRDFGLAPDQEPDARARAMADLARWRGTHGGETRDLWAVRGLAAAGYTIPPPTAWGAAGLPPGAVAILAKAARDKRPLVAYTAVNLLGSRGVGSAMPTYLFTLATTRRQDLRRAARLAVLNTADRKTLLSLPAVAGRIGLDPARAVDLLQALAGNHTWGRGEAALKRWRRWLDRNGPYLHRPAGSRRFLLNRQARAAGRPVDPVTGRPRAKGPAGAK